MSSPSDPADHSAPADPSAPTEPELSTTIQGPAHAAPGTWTVRALSRSGNGEAVLTADGPGLHQTQVAVA